MPVSRHQVVIVGSRCAGAATAFLLARMGHDVAVLDRSTFPSDTLSTHGIARPGVVQLHRWGLLDAVLASGAPPVRMATFHVPGGDPVERPVKATAGIDALVAPRRHVLDALLRESAVAAGATLYPAATVTDLTRDDSGRVTGVQTVRPDGKALALGARCVVGADGRNSVVADLVDAPLRYRALSPSGTLYTYVKGLETTGFEFHLAPSAMVGVFPTHDGECCVLICAPGEHLSPVLRAGAHKLAALRAMIADSAPALSPRLRRLRASRVRGAVQLHDVLRRPGGPGWALVGDAGYHRDPITAYGISDAFRDAELLARSLDAWLSGRVSEPDAVRAYDQARSRSIEEIFAITRALATFPGIPRFVQLQKQLSRAMEQEALMASALPEPRSESALAT